MLLKTPNIFHVVMRMHECCWIVCFILNVMQLGKWSPCLCKSGPAVKLGGGWQPASLPAVPEILAIMCKCTSQNLPEDAIFALSSTLKGSARGRWVASNGTWLWQAWCAGTLLAAWRCLQVCLHLPYFFFFVSLWVVGFCYFGVYVPILYFCPYYNSLPRNTSALRSFHITSVEQAASPAGINLCTCRDPPEPGAWSCVGLVTSKSSWMFIHPVLAAKSTHVCVCQ